MYLFTLSYEWNSYVKVNTYMYDRKYIHVAE